MKLIKTKEALDNFYTSSCYTKISVCEILVINE